MALGLSMVGGTLLSLSRSPHWFIRGWDFPRVLIASLAALSGISYYLLFFGGQGYEWAFLVLIGLCVLWQLYKILPYTPLAPVSVKRSSEERDGHGAIRLFVSNVKMENDQYDHWLSVVRSTDPDVILAVEVDDTWLDHIRELEEDHPHTVFQPQSNYYGMALFSRLPLHDPKVRFLVQEDIPSIHTEVELRNGRTVYLHGVHPRPPEPLRSQNATPRDAEVVLLAREIKQAERQPTIVAGDFNDVAWSHTSKLFQNLSGLLDPRRGRGLYSTFDANNPFFRFPLDHIFHSNEFKLINIELMEHVGSDHFPVLADLSYEPEARREQPEPDQEPGEEEEADEKIRRAREGEHVKEGGMTTPPPAGE